MSGTMNYTVKTQHVYQRKFDSDSLGRALGSSHWYIISRRPSVRIIPESVNLDDNILTLSVITRDSVHCAKEVHSLVADLGFGWAATNFEVHADGAYFSFFSNEKLMHGDAWALASLLSHAREDFARQEVLYIGQAFGKGGAGNAWERTRNHEKLQRIYEDHVGYDWDIFVSPLILEKRSWSTEDHIDDADEGPSLTAYYEHFADHNGRIRKASVDLIEHSLISYFAPPYNERLKEWRPSNPTDAMRKMQSGGFRLLHVYLNGWMGLTHFYSHQESEQIRSHFISQDIPPEPRPPVLRGISSPRLSGWRLDAKLVKEGRAIFADMAEYSGVELKIFGDEAPVVRIPAEVVLAAPSRGVPTAVADEYLESHGILREKVREGREALRKSEEPISHSGKSSYDPSTGLIQVGQDTDGVDVSWQLNDPQEFGVQHGLIIGDSKRGKSNFLRVIILEAALSGVFSVFPVDLRNEHDFMQWCKPFADPWMISTDAPKAIENLRGACRAIDVRAAAGGYAVPTRGTPGILFAVDDADEILADVGGAEMIERILAEGGRVGIGIVAVVRNFASIERNSLARSLATVGNRVAFMNNGDSYLMDLRATYGPRRSSTMQDGTSPTLILHWSVTQMTLGFLLALGDHDLNVDEAQEWARNTAGCVEGALIPWDTLDGDDRSWWSLDSISGTMLFVRQHSDGWALVGNISRTGGRETQIEALEWAEKVLAARFNGIEHSNWVLGPTTGELGLYALYAQVSGQPVPKPFPLEAELRWRY